MISMKKLLERLPKMYYVANARMPSEKAHGIQIAKMCEAFIEEGVDLTLVVPSRNMHQSMQEFYDLRVHVPIVRLPVFNLYNYQRPGYFVSSLSFMLVSLLFLWWKRFCGERFIVYTVDLDNYSSSALPIAPAQLFTEMHGGKPDTLAQHFLFRHLRGVFAINTLIVDEFKKQFSLSSTYYLVEPNGVDATLFGPKDKKEARQKLQIPHDRKIVLYTGRFFTWKGLEILPLTASLTPMVEWYIVGGTREDFCAVSNISEIPKNMHFIGSQEQSTIPWWLAAADALIVLGTKRDKQSYFYTSPMKLFEYLLSNRSIIASDTPAIRQIVSDREVFLYKPDNATDLADKVQEAVLQTPAVQARISMAYSKGITHSWSGRAKRIIESIQKSLHDKK